MLVVLARSALRSLAPRLLREKIERGERQLLLAEDPPRVERERSAMDFRDRVLLLRLLPLCTVTCFSLSRRALGVSSELVLLPSECVELMRSDDSSCGAIELVLLLFLTPATHGAAQFVRGFSFAKRDAPDAHHPQLCKREAQLSHNGRYSCTQRTTA